MPRACLATRLEPVSILNYFFQSLILLQVLFIQQHKSLQVDSKCLISVFHLIRAAIVRDSQGIHRREIEVHFLNGTYCEFNVYQLSEA